MTIRTARSRDLNSCLKIARTKELKLTQGGYITHDILKDFLSPYFLVAEIENRVCGFIVAEHMAISKGVIIWWMGVDKMKRGQGIGSNLLIEFQKRCKRKGREWIILHSALSNKKTLSFYKKHKYIFGDKLRECIKLL